MPVAGGQPFAQALCRELVVHWANWELPEFFPCCELGWSHTKVNIVGCNWVTGNLKRVSSVSALRSRGWETTAPDRHRGGTWTCALSASPAWGSKLGS